MGPGNYSIRKPVQSETVDMSVDPITQAAWYQAVDAMEFGGVAIEIFNPSGSPLIISTGDVGEEDDNILPYTIPPGGTSGPYMFELKAGRPLSFKALDADVNNGRLIVNLFG